MTSENMNTDQQAALAAANLGGLQKAQNAASWSDHMEDLMQGWGEKAAGLRWIHSKDAGTWKKFADKLSMWGIVLTTVASTAAVATANMDAPAGYLFYRWHRYDCDPYPVGQEVLQRRGEGCGPWGRR